MKKVEQKELDVLKGEIAATNSASDSMKYKVGRDLLNGMGDQMMEVLKSPPQKEEKKVGLFDKIRRMFSKV